MAPDFLKRVFLLLLFSASTLSAVELLPPGNRPLPLGVHALVGAKVFLKPGESLDSATIIIRDGFIESVGKDISPPGDARIWEMNGSTIYAGFIDSYLHPGAKAATEPPPAKENLTAGKFYGVTSERDPRKPGTDLPLVAPERRAASTYSPDPKALEKMRALGFTSANVVSDKGIFRGTTAFVALSDADSSRALIGTFQHVLEGYKVADEIAAHGAGASTFADWWAYKFEVYDAIPFNGSLMRDRGALVSFNSDSPDLARRLNTEAAKAVKFGGTPEEEALKFVTINPAKQLRIDKTVGSLEPGKDADFVLWSRSPLDSTAVCLQTWIEGKKYFDRTLEEERFGALEKERMALIEKAKQFLKAGGDSAKPDEAGKKKFFQRALEHLHDGVERHCDDE